MGKLPVEHEREYWVITKKESVIVTLKMDLTNMRERGFSKLDMIKTLAIRNSFDIS